MENNFVNKTLIFIYNFIFPVFCSFIDREEKVSIKGDEPTVHQKGRRSLYSHSDATSTTFLNQGLNLLTITTTDNCTINNNNNELYNFARYGNEWPS